MSEFGRRLWGDPCRECGYSWSISQRAAVEAIDALPNDFAAALVASDGSERIAGAPWNVTSYVFHVADNFRIWSERLAGLSFGADKIVAYDQDELADARGYEEQPLAVGLWSLRRAIEDWRAAVQLCEGRDIVMRHPEMGDQDLTDVTRQIGHDGAHHLYDVSRAMHQ